MFFFKFSATYVIFTSHLNNKAKKIICRHHRRVVFTLNDSFRPTSKLTNVSVKRVFQKKSLMKFV